MKVNHQPVPAGLTISARTGGGGGFGPAWRRPVEKVLDDLTDGYISSNGAQWDYGIRFVGATRTVDEAATAAVRAAKAGIATG